MAGTRDRDLSMSSRFGPREKVVALLLRSLFRCDWAPRVRSLLGVTDVDRTGTLLTPHPSTGFEKLDKARLMIPLRCLVRVGDSLDRARNIVAVLGKYLGVEVVRAGRGGKRSGLKRKKWQENR